MFERFSILARRAVMIARVEAGRTGADSIDTEHLLMAILCVDPALNKQLRIENQVDSIGKKPNAGIPRQLRSQPPRTFQLLLIWAEPSNGPD
jgi:hypothetical protein